jgi:hypothetical protein
MAFGSHYPHGSESGRKIVFDTDEWQNQCLCGIYPDFIHNGFYCWNVGEVILKKYC